MTAPRLAAGEVVAGKYTIRSHVRDDGTISTHFGADAAGRELAIKLYTPALGQRQDVLTALQAVHAKLSTLPPELVVPVLDAGVDGQRGNALFTVTERAALLPLPRLGGTAITVVLRSLARTLDTAHGQGLFHHALSPGNVLVDGESPRVVRVLDFGMNLARAAVPTQAGYAHAAPWMAPEQLDGANAGPLADVFSVGLLTFHMLTGGSFWRAVTPQGLDTTRLQQEVRAQRGAATQRASELQMTMPSSLDAFFARALALQPEQRFANVSEVVAGFEKAMANPSVAPGPMKLAQPGGGNFKQTQYAAEPDPTPAPAKNRFKSTQYAADPQAELAKAAPAQAAAHSSSHRPPPGVPTLMDPPPVPALPQHLAGAPVPGVPLPVKQRSWPPPADVVPVASMPPAPPKSSKAPLIIVLLLLVLGGGGAAAYFFVFRAPPPAPTAKKDDSKTEDDKSEGDDDDKTASAGDDQPKKKSKSGGDKPSGDDSAKPSTSGKAATSASAAIGEPPPKDAAEVTIQCNPACDAVSIDGKAVADPAAPVSLAAGTHTVVASKAGYKATTDTFTVKAKTPTTRVYTLVLAPAIAPKPSAKPPCGKFLKKCD